MTVSSATRNPPTSALDLAQLLSRVEYRVTRRLAETLAAAGSTVEQWRILLLLSDGAGHAMTEISDFALVPAPTLTRLVDRMVANNLVYRRVDHQDRRRILVFLSDRGKSHYYGLKRQVAQHRATLAHAVDNVPELTDLLLKVDEIFSGSREVRAAPLPTGESVDSS